MFKYGEKNGFILSKKVISVAIVFSALISLTISYTYMRDS
jgi:hypothetical protein